MSLCVRVAAYIAYRLTCMCNHVYVCTYTYIYIHIYIYIGTGKSKTLTHVYLKLCTHLLCLVKLLCNLFWVHVLAA
jgi:hypothetical protein